MNDPNKFRGKYRVNSTRLKHWDYSKSGHYFVTICTKDKQPYFGNIEKEDVLLTEIGRVAKGCWQDIPKHFPFVTLDEFVIMPNHVHGIIVINNDIKVEVCEINNVETCGINNVETCNINNVETCHGMSLPEEHLNKFSRPVPKSLSMVINQFKGSVKRLCNKRKYDFFWQPRFYDRIIRSNKELDSVRKYISENPAKWELDKYSVNI